MDEKEQEKSDKYFLVGIVSGIKAGRFSDSSVRMLKCLFRIIANERVKADREAFYARHDLLNRQESECVLCDEAEGGNSLRHNWTDKDWHAQALRDLGLRDINLKEE